MRVTISTDSDIEWRDDVMLSIMKCATTRSGIGKIQLHLLACTNYDVLTGFVSRHAATEFDPLKLWYLQLLLHQKDRDRTKSQSVEEISHECFDITISSNVFTRRVDALGIDTTSILSFSIQHEERTSRITCTVESSDKKNFQFIIESSHFAPTLQDKAQQLFKTRSHVRELIQCIRETHSL